MNIISIFETHQAPLKIYIYIFKLWYINTKDYVKQTLFLLLDHSGARQKYIYFTENNALRPKIFFLPNVMLCKIMELNLVTFFKRDTNDCPVGKGGAPWGGGGYSLIWLIRGCAAGQRMVLGLFVLNRVHNFICLSSQGVQT